MLRSVGFHSGDQRRRTGTRRQDDAEVKGKPEERRLVDRIANAGHVVPVAGVDVGHGSSGIVLDRDQMAILPVTFAMATLEDNPAAGDDRLSLIGRRRLVGAAFDDCGYAVHLGIGAKAEEIGEGGAARAGRVGCSLHLKEGAPLEDTEQRLAALGVEITTHLLGCESNSRSSCLKHPAVHLVRMHPSRVCVPVLRLAPLVLVIGPKRTTCILRVAWLAHLSSLWPLRGTYQRPTICVCVATRTSGFGFTCGLPTPGEGRATTGKAILEVS